MTFMDALTILLQGMALIVIGWAVGISIFATLITIAMRITWGVWPWSKL